MHLHLDGANLGEAQAIIVCEAYAALRIAETIIAVLALKPRIARFHSVFTTPEEGIKRFLRPSEHILQHLRVDIPVFWPDSFDLRQFVGLIIVRDGLARH